MKLILSFIFPAVLIFKTSLIFSQQPPNSPCNFANAGSTTFQQQFGRFGKVKTWTGEVGIEITTKTNDGYKEEEIHSSASGGIMITNHDPEAMKAGMANIWPWYTPAELMNRRGDMTNQDWTASTSYNSTSKILGGGDVTTCSGGGMVLSTVMLNIQLGGSCYTLSAVTNPIKLKCSKTNSSGETELFDDSTKISATNFFTGLPPKKDTLIGDTTYYNDDKTVKTRFTWKLYPYSEQPKVEVKNLDPDRPHFACSKNDEDAIVKFTAEVTPAKNNGEFIKFEVRMGNKPAKILANKGGQNPLLVLEGNGKKTDKVNIVAIYKKKGEFIFSQPFELNWVSTDSIKFKNSFYNLGENCFGFNNDPTAKLEIDAYTHVWKNGKEKKENIQWEINSRGSIKFQQDLADGGQKCKFTTDGLPQDNNDFGIRKIKYKYNDSDCDCDGEEKEIKIFFYRDAKNNPEAKYPNWFYYWKQTKAWINTGECKMVNTIPNPKNGGTPQKGEVARYEPYDDVLYITEGLAGSAGGAPGDVGEPNRLGIDAFATCIRHEDCHRTDYINWWGLKMVNYSWSDDCDMDEVPNAVEALLGCKNCAATCWATLIKAGSAKIAPATAQAAQAAIQACKFSCPNMPTHLLQAVPDNEVNAYKVGWRWKVGDADKKDWAWPGKQAPGTWKW